MTDEPIYTYSDKALAEIQNLEQFNTKVWIEGKDKLLELFKDAGYTVKDGGELLSATPDDVFNKMIESNGKWEGDIILSSNSLAGYCKALKRAMELVNDGAKIAIFLWECQPSRYLDNIASYKVGILS